MAMEVNDVLKALERNTGAFPREAVEAAMGMRETITPELLRILEDTVERADEIVADEKDGPYFAYLYAMYLLAQFRKTRAYPLVVRFSRLPQDVLDCLAGDFVTEDLACVLASVCGGDTGPIEDLIEDAAVNEYVRGAAIRSLLVLIAAGDRSRDEVMGYFKTLFEGKLERSPSNAWNALASCATDLHPDEVYGHIVAAYDEELIERGYMQREEVDRAYAQDKRLILDRLPTDEAVYIQDVIEDMEWWACFKQPKRSKKAPRREPKRLRARTLFFRATSLEPSKSFPILQPEPKESSEPQEMPAPSHGFRTDKVKRNAPCPCGSGKKYKKCCGRVT
jgi:uncharacterized protein DUF1186/SEC-C motif-containing protein